MVNVFSRSSINPHLCSLYFKGLVGDNSLAGFGVAICGQKDDLLFHLNGPIHGSDITVLEAELTALKRGLTEAAGLGIEHISIYCDYYPVYELISFPGRFMIGENKTALLVNDVKRIRERFSSSSPILVAEDRIRYAYELARETIVSQISIFVDPLCHTKPDKQKTCPICFNDDFEAEQMFSVVLCGHQFCVECVKRYLEVTLLEGAEMRCPQYQCEFKLTFQSCVNLLTPKLSEMWERRIEEESIPVAERVYCPKPRCSALMSKTEDGTKRCCFKCGQLFCINCKVPWHSNLSCDEYKRFGPNPSADDIKLNALANKKLWRQCEKCHHMIELSQGCIKVTCRCGHSFCYTCGAEWKEGGCPHRTRMLAMGGVFGFMIIVTFVILIIYFT